ncbi:hypothetical protein [Thiofilum flexile]|uniref:hypothetical protein n=1 Tax=Thiofilum flexile TaxID=125627 RepID=UPI00035C473D|nr:hypothetical protein [Thiofilum flexile]
MEYALLIALALGMLLIALAWLMITIAGFRHHFVTGIVAMVPVLNLLILPTIWHRARGWFFTGLVGILLAVGAWGVSVNSQAGQNMQRLLGNHWFTQKLSPMLSPSQGDQEPPETVTQEVNISPIPISTVSLPPNTTSSTSNMPTETGAQHELPSNALYQMGFQPIELSAANHYIGQSLRIRRSDQKWIEGRLLEATDKMLRIEQNLHGQTQTQELETRYIQSIEVLKY